MANFYETSGAERARVEKIWNRQGKSGFIVVRSAEGALSTVESIRGLRPAGDPKK